MSTKDDETGSIISDLGSDIVSINGSIATEPSTTSSKPSAATGPSTTSSKPSAATGPSATNSQPSAVTKSTAAATAPTHSSGGTIKQDLSVQQQQQQQQVITTTLSEPVATNIEDYKKELTYPIRLIAQLELDKSYLILTRGFHLREIMVLYDIIDSKRNGVEFILIRTIKNALHTIKVQHIRVHQDDVLFFYTDEHKAELLANFKPAR